MSPYQHGEVFVTDDGAETDLDLGHYERFIDENLSVNSNVTSERLFFSNFPRKRRRFSRGTVQVILTHKRNQGQGFRVGGDNTDVVITEIGERLAISSPSRFSRR
jgi:CTP synthase